MCGVHNPWVPRERDFMVRNTCIPGMEELRVCDLLSADRGS